MIVKINFKIWNRGLSLKIGVGDDESLDGKPGRTNDWKAPFHNPHLSQEVSKGVIQLLNGFLFFCQNIIMDEYSFKPNFD